MKKYLSIIFLFLLGFLLVACGYKTNPNLEIEIIKEEVTWTYIGLNVVISGDTKDNPIESGITVNLFKGATKVKSVSAGLLNKETDENGINKNTYAFYFDSLDKDTTYTYQILASQGGVEYLIKEAKIATLPSGGEFETKPLAIKTAEEFLNIKKLPGAFYKIENDIDLGGQEITQITNNLYAIIDGNNKTISNFTLKINSESNSLFGEIDNNLIGKETTTKKYYAIKDLNFKDIQVVSDGYVNQKEVGLIGSTLNSGARLDNITLENVTYNLKLHGASETKFGGLIANNSGQIANINLKDVNINLYNASKYNFIAGGVSGYNSNSSKLNKLNYQSGDFNFYSSDDYLYDEEYYLNSVGTIGGENYSSYKTEEIISNANLTIKQNKEASTIKELILEGEGLNYYDGKVLKEEQHSYQSKAEVAIKINVPKDKVLVKLLVDGVDKKESLDNGNLTILLSNQKTFVQAIYGSTDQAKTFKIEENEDVIISGNKTVFNYNEEVTLSINPKVNHGIAGIKVNEITYPVKDDNTFTFNLMDDTKLKVMYTYRANNYGGLFARSYDLNEVVYQGKIKVENAKNNLYELIYVDAIVAQALKLVSKAVVINLDIEINDLYNQYTINQNLNNLKILISKKVLLNNENVEDEVVVIEKLPNDYLTSQYLINLLLGYIN